MWPPQVPGPLESLSLSGNVFITDPSGSDLHLTCSAGGLHVLSGSEESACKAGVLGPIPGLGRSPGGGNCNPLQYSCLENPMDGGAWWATVHGVAKSQIWLRDWHTSLVKLSRIKIPNKKHSTSSDSDPSFLYLFCSIILSTWNLYFVYFILYFSTEDVSFLRPNTLEFCSWLYLCSTLCDPMESSPPGSSVHGIL